MLLRVRLKNFLSFDSETEFNMFPNLKISASHEHVYSRGREVPLLRQAALFGENASGKSNLVKALSFIRSFAIDPKFLDTIEFKDYQNLLVKGNDHLPVELAIEFESRGNYFLYEFKIAAHGVAAESLSLTFPEKGEIRPIFIRENSSLVFPAAPDIVPIVADMTNTLLRKNPKSSLISLNRDFPLFKDKEVFIAANWLRDNLEIIGIDSYVPDLIYNLHHNPDLMKFIQSVACRLELGLQNVNVHDEDIESWTRNHKVMSKKIPKLPEDSDVDSMSLSSNNAPILSVAIENGIRKVYQLVFDQIGKDGHIAHLDTVQQSSGTLRALTLLPALYHAAKKGKTVVIDEINLCLSPSMVQGFVRYFATAPDTKGQLIFTTHDTQLLMDKDILRSDEIWFVDKKDGVSTIYSHSDFKEHPTLSRFKGYNEGRFGAINFINLSE